MEGPKRKGSDVVVVGAGAIGLAIAHRLALAGRRVVILGGGPRAGEATRAAGGMLSPLAESPGPGPFLDLGLESLALWPAFAARLEEESGIDLDLRLDGKLLLAFDDEQAQALAGRARWITRAGHEARSLDGPALRAHAPMVGAAARAGLFVVHDGQVDNRALGAALAAAARAAGCTLLPEARASELVVAGGAVLGVRTTTGEAHAADVVVLAAGAWSAEVAGLPRPLPVRPLKGQMISLAAPAGLSTLVESEGCYLIPRRGGAVWVGATSEEVGFTLGASPAARAALRSSAARVVPTLADAAELEAWSGFRPATPDGLPILGRDPDLGGLVHATGHFRNGILLTPVTARVVERIVDGGTVPGLEPFRPDRFPARSPES